MSFPRYPKYRPSGVEWLGEVPAHWHVRRFPRCVSIQEGQVDPEDAKYSSMTLLAPNHIESGTGKLLTTEGASEQGAESGKYLCKAGEVIYSKIRPALRKACIAPEDCLCSADMYPLRGHSGMSNAFLLWMILSDQFSAWAVLESQRVAMPKINRESLKELSLCLPTEAEQRAIAAFLDRETAKIDALVAEQGRLIELLKEKRQAVIFHAITKGLDPTAPMKSSGIEWLGDVPAHWPQRVLRYCCTKIMTGGTPPPQFLGCEGEECLDWYTPGDFDGSVVLGRSSRRISGAAVSAGELRVFPPGAVLVVGIGATLGAVGMLPVSACANQQVNALVPRSGVTSAFLAHHLRVITGSLRASANTATLPILNQQRMGDTPVVIPPPAEQASIVDHVSRETGEIDALAAGVWNVANLLQERRSALISAAVTGQIDVRNAVPIEVA